VTIGRCCRFVVGLALLFGVPIAFLLAMAGGVA
jgi:hypothetical protein